MKKIVLVITMLGIILSCQKEEIDPKQTVTDIDGNQYRTIQIGTQVWMAENLKSSKYCNGDPIPNINDAIQWSNLTTGAWSIYPIQILHSYGKFYNWYAVDDARNICPCNWHVPTDAEWTVLLEFLEWKSGDFSPLPGGLRLPSGSFHGIGEFGYWWTSTEDDTEYAWYVGYDIVFGDFYLPWSKGNGMSVRCLKD
jgi:hypothetical protein